MVEGQEPNPRPTDEASLGEFPERALALPDDLNDSQVQEIAAQSRYSIVFWAGSVANITIAAGVITLQILQVFDESMFYKTLAAQEALAGFSIYGMFHGGGSVDT